MGVLGFRDLTPELHRPVCEFVQDMKTKRALLVLPRGHFKTTISTISYSIWLLINNPNERIIICGSTSTNAERFLSAIRQAFENNEMFRWAFPELIPDFASRNTNWNQSSITIPRSKRYPDPSVDTIGVGGKVAGRHTTVKLGDDIIGEQASKNVEEMKKILEWHELSESLLESPDVNIDRQSCTRWHHTDDVAGYIMAKDKRYKTMIRAAIEDGKPIFPQRFNMPMLEEMRTRKPRIFSTQYMNQPLNEEDLDFRVEWLKYYSVGAEGKIIPSDGTQPTFVQDLQIYLRLDPALSSDPESCRSAFVVDGIDSKDRVYLLEVVAKRLDPPGIIDELFRLNKRWKPTAVAIEEVLFQRVLKYWLLKEATRRGITIPIRPLKTSTQRSKDERIRGVSPYFAGGMVYILKGQTDFIEEYSTFPLGHTVDILDAFSYGPQMWRRKETPEAGPLPVLPPDLDPASARYWDNWNRKKLGLERDDSIEAQFHEEGELSELFG